MRKGLQVIPAVILTVVFMSVIGMFILNVYTKGADAAERMEFEDLEDGCNITIEKAVTFDEWLYYIEMATKKTWSTGKVCTVKVNEITGSLNEDKIKEAVDSGQEGIISIFEDNCRYVYGGMNREQMRDVVFWIGDTKPWFIGYDPCSDNSFTERMWTASKNLFTDSFEKNIYTSVKTLYVAPKEEYCKNTEWLPSNNFERYSQSRGVYNDEICLDERYELPIDVGQSFSIYEIKSEIQDCIAKNSFPINAEKLINDENRNWLENTFSRDELITMYATEYNDNRVDACSGVNYKFNLPAVKFEDFIQVFSDIEIDENKLIFNDVYNCKLNKYDWTVSSSYSHSCLHVVYNGVIVDENNVPDNFNLGNKNVKVFYVFEKTQNEDLRTYEPIKRTLLSTSYHIPKNGLNDIVIEITG
jgi:hypothetical protein